MEVQGCWVGESQLCLATWTILQPPPDLFLTGAQAPGHSIPKQGVSSLSMLQHCPLPIAWAPNFRSHPSISINPLGWSAGKPVDFDIGQGWIVALSPAPSGKGKSSLFLVCVPRRTVFAHVFPKSPAPGTAQALGWSLLDAVAERDSNSPTSCHG